MKVFPDVEKGVFPTMKMSTLNSRAVQGAILIILLIFLTLSLNALTHARQAGNSILEHYKDSISKVAGVKSKAPEMAKRLYPEELMQRPLATNLTSIPKYFHQSWQDETLPTKFEEWSASCRKAHPDWEWILWTDADNRNMVEKYAPWFIETYESLESEIFRADTARNIYMHVFGGVYADLDTECILPYDSLFENYNVTTNGYRKEEEPVPSSKDDVEEEKPSKHSTDLSSQPKARSKAERKIFLGRMGTSNGWDGSIPNAWMASTPGHPFWLLPLDAADEMAKLSRTPEATTGPVALFHSVNAYEDKFRGGKGTGGKKLDKYYAKSPWRNLYKLDITKSRVTKVKDLHEAPPQSLTVLPFWEIYPYSWERDGQAYRDMCSAASKNFDANRCKLLLGVEHWGTHSISYWSHSWEEHGHQGHWDEHLKELNKSNKKEEEEEEPEDREDSNEEEKEDGGKKKGDALEANREAEKKKNEQEREEEALKQMSTAALPKRRRR